jgi:hypothetical protein
VLLWVYYSAQIFLLGAEFTRTYSYRHGSRSHQQKPVKAEAPTQSSQGDSAQTVEGAKVTPSARKRSESSCETPQPARQRRDWRVPATEERTEPRGPAWAKLRIAAGIAAAMGLVAGEVLNELRRNGTLLRRRFRRA